MGKEKQRRRKEKEMGDVWFAIIYRHDLSSSLYLLFPLIAKNGVLV